MSPELYWLTLTSLLTGLLWVPYIVNRLAEHGVFAGLWDPEGITATNQAWAARMMKAHENAVENLAVFAPLALIVHVTGAGNGATAAAAAVYFIARAGHALVFTLGVPVLRVVLFLVGVGAQLTLALRILGWIE